MTPTPPKGLGPPPAGRPVSVHALAQALANIRPPADPSDSTWIMWLASARAIGAALPPDFGHNFTLLCKTLEPR